MTEEHVDWAVFDKDPEMTCTCRCGTEFRSHCKAFYTKPPYTTVTRKPCPNCGSNTNCYHFSSDPETFTVRG